MTCENCHRPKPREYLRVAIVAGRPGEQLLACRRCRLSIKVRPLWDRMRAAEHAVLQNPDDSSAIAILRSARADFDVALRPVGKVRKKAAR